MNAAIERVRRAVDRGRAKPGRLRGGLLAALLVGFAAPSSRSGRREAIRSQAAALLPEAARASIGSSLLDEVRRISGAPLPAPRGQEALPPRPPRVAPAPPYPRGSPGGGGGGQPPPLCRGARPGGPGLVGGTQKPSPAPGLQRQGGDSGAPRGDPVLASFSPREPPRGPRGF